MAVSAHSPKSNPPYLGNWVLSTCRTASVQSHISPPKPSDSSKSICFALLAKHQGQHNVSPCPTFKSSKHCSNANRRNAFGFELNRFKQWCMPQMVARWQSSKGQLVQENRHHSPHSRLPTAQPDTAYLAWLHQGQRRPSCKKALALIHKLSTRCLCAWKMIMLNIPSS